jgi:hypothetical protein
MSTPGPKAPRKPTPRPMRKVTPVPSRRQDRRYLLPMPVLLCLPRSSVEAVTGDVSYGGLFAITPTRLALGQLVRVELLLPPNDILFEAPAKLVYARPAFATDERGGVGVQFYGLGRETQARWDAFIDYARAAYPESAARWADVAHGEVKDDAYPRSEQQVCAIRVQVRGVADLEVMLRRDFTRGTMIVAIGGGSHLRAGDEIAIHVFHPLADDFFELSGRVRRVIADGPIRALDLELTRLDDERRARFAEFIEDGQAWIYDEESFTDE